MMRTTRITKFLKSWELILFRRLNLDEMKSKLKEINAGDKIWKGFTKIFPSINLGKLNWNHYLIKSFVKKISKEIEQESKVLDAGAGSCQWKKYFDHTNYESTDFEQIFNQDNKKIHTFICDVKDIPKKDETYDAIINIEVLEHVPEPLKVLKEFHRILKKKGVLYLTTPQSWSVHGYPYNYFNFTKGGLEYLFKEVGFRKYEIYPKGGIFVEIGVKLKELPYYILSQYLKIVKKKGTKRTPEIEIFKPFSIILLPLFLITYPIFQIIVPIVFGFLDKLDLNKDFTLGYCCIVEK